MNGNGREKAIEVLTMEAACELTGEEEIPGDVPLARDFKDHRGTYRVEDIASHWPGEPISQDEFDRRLLTMHRKGNLWSTDGLLYLILTPPPAPEA